MMDPTNKLCGTLLSIAADIETAETAIKNAIIAAAEEGDTARVIELTRRWIDLPPVEVLSHAPPPTTSAPAIKT